MLTSRTLPASLALALALAIWSEDNVTLAAADTILCFGTLGLRAALTAPSILALAAASVDLVIDANTLVVAKHLLCCDRMELTLQHLKQHIIHITEASNDEDWMKLPSGEGMRTNEAQTPNKKSAVTFPFLVTGQSVSSHASPFQPGLHSQMHLPLGSTLRVPRSVPPHCLP